MGAQVGVIGLAVMGQNLALNLADHGYRVLVYNRTGSVTRSFVEASPALEGADSLVSLAASLDRPRRIILMVKAGAPVQETLNFLLDLLDPGDVVVDGGNSHWRDTERRIEQAGAFGIHYIGAGISGGEEGARHGPSIMPGGSAAGWEVVGETLTSIAAITPDGEPCAAWIGPGGSGHFVKMVHNGIEYVDMQLIAEAYHLLTRSGLSPDTAAAAFRGFGKGPLDSYLIDITALILEHRDQDGSPLIGKILDAAVQKGTGKWTVDSALELGQPANLIGEAVFARMMSALKEPRARAAALLSGPIADLSLNEDEIGSALYASKIVGYAQGFMLLQAASDEYGWNLSTAGIPRLWRAGCIIRARILDDVGVALRRNPKQSLLVDAFFTEELARCQTDWRHVLTQAISGGVPVPAYSAALAFYDSFRSSVLPANLIQAQRDFFGAHTYERVDRPRGEFFHTEW